MFIMVFEISGKFTRRSCDNWLFFWRQKKKKRKLKPFFKVSQSNLEIYIDNETIEDEKIGE